MHLVIKFVARQTLKPAVSHPPSFVNPMAFACTMSSALPFCR